MKQKTETSKAVTFDGRCETKLDAYQTGFYMFNYTLRAFNQQSGFERVSKKRPCPICHKPDWCSVTKDGNLALRARVSAGSIKTAANNTFVHVLNPTTIKSRVSPASASVCEKLGAKVAENKFTDPARLDEVYTFLLGECLQLNEIHGDHLLGERGLGDTTIAANLYASVPKNSKSIETINRDLNQKFGDKLRGVPGFYLDKNQTWEFRFPRNGFFVPYRDIKGRIVGLQIRQDGNVKPKYYWISTPPTDWNDGTASGTPIHFVKPNLVKEEKRLFITEGALKADCISEFSGEAVIGIAGVSCFPDTIADDLQKQLPELEQVIIAFDMDLWKNTNVKTQLFRLVRIFEESPLEEQIKVWDISDGKGYDDYLFNEQGRD